MSTKAALTARMRAASIPPMRGRGLGATAAIVAFVLLTATRSRAQTEQDKALATTLFNDAKALLAQGQVAEACRKLEASQHLDPLPGTLLNLGACHEREGLTASAWTELKEARALAERDQRADRVAFAEQHMKDLEPRLSRLAIEPSASPAPADVTVTRDGTPVPRESWGQRIPVNLGEHVIEVSAPGKKTWRAVIMFGAEGEQQLVKFGALDDEAPAPQVAAPEPVAPTEAPHGESSRGLSTRRTIALGAAGVAVAGVVVGTLFGLRAIDKHHDVGATCTTRPCSQTSLSLNDDAKTAADVSTIAFAVGAAGLVAGAILWFGDSSSSSSTTQLRIAPTWTFAGAGISAAGRF